MIVRCKNCNKSFYIRPSHLVKNSCCSKKCAYEFKTKSRSILTKCKFCQKDFLVSKSRLKDGRGKHCSKRCAGLNQKKGKDHPLFNSVKKKCIVCHKIFLAKRSRIKTTNVICCSKICLGKYQSGENATNWKGGKTNKNAIIRSSKKYARWRKTVFERDKYTCQHCGDSRGGNLNAHHIKPFALFPELIFELNNGLTLCEKCHNKIKIEKSGRPKKIER